MTKTTSYAVIPAPGFFGDYAVVVSAHRTIEAARKAARPGEVMRYVVIESSARKGDRIHRADVRETSMGTR